MKSITILYNQNQPQKASGNGKAAVDKGNEKISRRTKKEKKDEHEKSANTHSIAGENDRASVQDRIGMIIHEIRNPLTAISLSNQSLREEMQFDNLPLSLNVLSFLKMSTGSKPC